MKPTLLILAAGLGSRYGGLKQIEKLGPSGEILMEYAIYDAIKAGYGKVVFVLREEIEEEFQSLFVQRFKGKINFDYVIQKTDALPEGYEVNQDRTKPWGTGQAVWLAGEKIQEPFAVINADDYYGSDVFELIKNGMMAPNNEMYFLAGYQLKRTLSEYGTVARAIGEIDAEGYLKSLSEKTQIGKNEDGIYNREEDESLVRFSGEEIVSMNLLGFTPSIFDYLENSFKTFLKNNSSDLKAEFYLPLVVNEIIITRKNKVKVLNTEANWFGVTYKGDKLRTQEKINELVNKGIYPKNLN